MKVGDTDDESRRFMAGAFATALDENHVALRKLTHSMRPSALAAQRISDAAKFLMTPSLDQDRELHYAAGLLLLLYSSRLCKWLDEQGIDASSVVQMQWSLRSRPDCIDSIRHALMTLEQEHGEVTEDSDLMAHLRLVNALAARIPK